VWVAAGNSVLIATPAGAVRTTVTGLFGAKALTLAPDGASVYVSGSTAGKIYRVSAAGVVLGAWTSQACPGRSAIVGDGLYYVYGCSAADAGVARFDLSTHDDAGLVQDVSAEALTAAGPNLITYSYGGSLTSYAIGGDGGLTKQATADVSTTYDVEISPDGGQVVATDYGSGYGVARYDAATLSPAGTFATGPYPDAVAWSPDGTRFAGVLNAYYDERPVHVFSAADGSAVTTSTSAGNTSYQSQAHQASWSADGRYLYSVAQENSGNPYLVVTPAAGQKSASLAVAVAPAGAYAKTMTITVRAANRAGLPVQVTVSQNGGVTRKTLTTDGSGAATWSLPGRASGTVTATAPADLAWLATTGSAKFSTPSAVTTKLSGAARTKNGVAEYTSVAKVRADLTVWPNHAGKVTVQLQYRAGGKWKTIQTATFATDADGTLPIGMRSATKKVTYRFVAKAAGDAVAAGSPGVTSRSFVVR
jgi:hypothetical protein